MSIYSGFATRQQEQKYNNLIETLIIAMKKRLIKFYSGVDCDEDKFKLLVKKIYKKMYLLEKGKFMIPKYTSCFTDLIDSLHIDINYDTISQCSSRISQSFSLRKDSMDSDGDQLRSNALLNNKKTLLQVKASKKYLNNASALSTRKDFKGSTSRIENEEDEMKRMFVPRSNSLDPVEEHYKANRNKYKSKELKDLKELRGTINMPKVEDFLPKREEMQSSNVVKRSGMFLDIPLGQTHSPQPPHKVVFRRQKYSKPDVKIQDL